MQGKAVNAAAAAAENGLRSMLSLFFVVHEEVLFRGSSVSPFLMAVLF